jgi:hypothetical protein
MALRPSDLPPGAKVRKQGYVATSSVAEYDRAFAERTARIGAKPLLGLENDLTLEGSALEARSVFAQLRLALGNKASRQRLVDQLKKALGVVADSVRASAPFGFGAGQESVGLTITIDSFLGTLQAELVFFRVDRVVSALVVAGFPDVRLTRADLTRLARPVSARIFAGLTPRLSAPPAIAGTPTAGQTLSASGGTWTNGPVSLAYQWQRCDMSGANCVAIAGAAAATYVLLDDDVGATVRVQVTATGPVGSATAVTTPTGVVAALAGPPVNVVLPTISGTATQGQALTATTGTWVGRPTTFTYQWQRCDAGGASCVAIDGTTQASYTVAAADAGATLRVTVAATNASGSTPAVSNQTGVVP